MSANSSVIGYLECFMDRHRKYFRHGVGLGSLARRYSKHLASERTVPSTKHRYGASVLMLRESHI
jgi:hypothetical protein